MSMHIPTTGIIRMYVTQRHSSHVHHHHVSTIVCNHELFPRFHTCDDVSEFETAREREEKKHRPSIFAFRFRYCFIFRRTNVWMMCVNTWAGWMKLVNTCSGFSHRRGKRWRVLNACGFFKNIFQPLLHAAIIRLSNENSFNDCSHDEGLISE